MSEGRPLGRVETCVWLVDRALPLNFCMIAELRFQPEREALERAVRAAQGRHPLLRSRIINDGRSLRFEPHPPGDIPAPEIQYRDGPTEDGLAEAERQINYRFADEDTSLWRVSLIRHPGGTATLVICFQHTIGDGISGALLVRDFIRALAGQPLEPLPMPPAVESRLPPVAHGWRSVLRFTWNMLTALRRWASLGGRPTPIRALIEDAPFSQRGAVAVSLAFNEEQTARLVAKARAERTTVHGALGAALCLACIEEIEQPGGVMGFGSPVNMRTRMSPPVGEDVGLLVSIAGSFHRPRQGMDFWDLAREVKSELIASIDRQDPFVLTPVLGYLGAIRALYPLNATGAHRMATLSDRWLFKTTTTGITNIGIVDAGGAGRVGAVHFIANPSAMGRLITTAGTHAGLLRWNFIGCTPRMSRERTAALAQRARQLLEKSL